ncbi:MAG: 4Fe-4S dicluster domain-containing protein [Clostridia bacterium]|nr:4Fe-4S dicluster domain-containing protein [Clostridia bacterium]
MIFYFKYNNVSQFIKNSNGGFIAPMALSALPDEKKPSACIACQSCEAVCPQQIKIHEVMAEFAELIK